MAGPGRPGCDGSHGRNRGRSRGGVDGRRTSRRDSGNGLLRPWRFGRARPRGSRLARSLHGGAAEVDRESGGASSTNRLHRKCRSPGARLSGVQQDVVADGVDVAAAGRGRGDDHAQLGRRLDALRDGAAGIQGRLREQRRGASRDRVRSPPLAHAVPRVERAGPHPGGELHGDDGGDGRDLRRPRPPEPDEYGVSGIDLRLGRHDVETRLHGSLSPLGTPLVRDCPSRESSSRSRRGPGLSGYAATLRARGGRERL